MQCVLHFRIHYALYVVHVNRGMLDCRKGTLQNGVVTPIINIMKPGSKQVNVDIITINVVSVMTCRHTFIKRLLRVKQA